MTQTNPRRTAPADIAPSAAHTILGIALGYLTSRSLHVAAGLGIADLLKDGPKSAEDLARQCDADPQALFRLLRVLAGHGIFAEDAAGRFRLTPAAALLQANVPGTLHDAVRMIGDIAGDGSWWTAVGQLGHSVRTGESGFRRVHGTGFFDYLAAHPEAGAWFDRGLANFTTTENAAIAGAYDFSPFRRVLDIAGGQGGLLAEILRQYLGASGLLFDQPQVVQDPAALSAAGLLDRCEIVAGDFFRAVPGGGGAYILKRILHDWNDAQCVRILRACREAMDAQSVLLVIDAVIPPGNDPHPGKIMDILMMALTEGRERTEAEFRALFRQAGLELTKVVPTPSVLSIVEAVRA